MPFCAIAGNKAAETPNITAPKNIVNPSDTPFALNITVKRAAKYKLCCPVKNIYFSGVNLATIKLAINRATIINATIEPNLFRFEKNLKTMRQAKSQR